jgi:hypothetical protein
MTEAECQATYRIDPDRWKTLVAELENPTDIRRSGKVRVLTESGRAKICRMLAAQAAQGEAAAVREGEDATQQPKRRGLAIPYQVEATLKPATGAVFEMEIIRCWPHIQNDKVAFCLLPATDRSDVRNQVPVRLNGPQQHLHNYRPGMRLKARLEPDGFWSSMVRSPEFPGRWANR